MHYLITGHTGFKGSWLALMLEMQGHTVSGISLEPPTNSMYNQAKVSSIFRHDLRVDIRDLASLKREVKKIDPEVIIHLAAQPLVRDSYEIPLETFEINVLGTLNLLEATRNLDCLKAVLIITTDKVYKNKKQQLGYVESDELGGDDPYSASKAAADIASQSWIKSFATVPVAIARAGNVIGGGDWAQDRIIPDLVKAYSAGEIPKLRYPDAIRPWQHVLDCLNGYIQLVNHQISQGFDGEWNFGPDSTKDHSVKDLVQAFANAWDIQGGSWKLDSDSVRREPELLMLDSTKARNLLQWNEKLDFESAVYWTAEWYKSEATIYQRTRSQIEKFLSLI